MPSFRQELHTALKTEVTDKTQVNSVDFALVRLQNSKDDIRYSLHVRPNQWSTAGLQTTDLLGYLGFERSTCRFVTNECYAQAIEASIDLASFAQAFSQAYTALQQAERELGACGIFFRGPEGWDFFQGKESVRLRRRRSLFANESDPGDGHTAQKSELLKKSSDEYFEYVLTWLERTYGKGWTTHYHPKHSPLSSQMRAAFDFLGLHEFSTCPEFDFEPCFWQFVSFERSDNPLINTNAEHVHQTFDAHATHFSSGLEQLLAVQKAVEPFGMSILPQTVIQPQIATTPTRQHSAQLSEVSGAKELHKYDVAISFAGPQRALAEKLAEYVRDAGYRVFYDEFYPEQHWGQDLTLYFDDIYRKESRFCVIFVSQEYKDREWTNHELRSARARALQEKGKEYVLPIRVDDVDLPGLPPTIGYLSLQQRSIEEVADLLDRKLQGK